MTSRYETCRRLALFAVVIAAAGSAAAQTTPGSPNKGPTVLYGMGPDPRDHVNVDDPPWRAVGKLQMARGSFVMSCTGALIGPAVVLTAAHCFYDERQRAYLPATSFHFLLGYDRGSFAGSATGVSFTVGPGYDPENEEKTRGSDWAVLRIDTALGTPDRVLPFSGDPPRLGSAVTVGGYSRDYLYALTADSHCRIIGRTTDGNGKMLLVHDCTAKRGTSGGPLLVQDALGWTVHGVEIETGRDDTRGVASIPTGLP
jgi:protease YdgD